MRGNTVDPITSSAARRRIGAPWAVQRVFARGALLGILLATPGPARPAWSAVQPDAPPKRPPSVMDSPGYVPLVDPASTAVVVGRRLNAPLVGKRFRGGARSLDQLGRTVCRLLERSHRDSLTLLCVTDDEFRDILWREFPQSRPVTGLTWEDGWRVLNVRLLSGTSGAVHDHGGQPWEFLGITADSVMAYKNFKLHSQITLTVRDDWGTIQRWRWLRGVVERKGAYKIYSTDD